ncbi:MAG: hypothetical protein SNJ53_09210, partial [Thermodesulfovibrionales bacterium]
MSIGIVVPTELEGNQLIEILTQKEQKSIQGKFFYSGFIRNRLIVITICGVGKANSAHATGLLIHLFNPQVLINVGVAGAYPSTGLNVGDVVVATSERYIDEGLQTRNGIFISMRDLGIRLTLHE